MLELDERIGAEPRVVKDDKEKKSKKDKKKARKTGIENLLKQDPPMEDFPDDAA